MELLGFPDEVIHVEKNNDQWYFCRPAAGYIALVHWAGNHLHLFVAIKQDDTDGGPITISPFLRMGTRTVKVWPSIPDVLTAKCLILNWVTSGGNDERSS